MPRFIENKRDGLEHPPEALREFVRAFQAGEIPDYQSSAWLMAVLFRGLSRKELEAFTLALATSGSVVKFPESLACVDKHSTGGVGDKTSLVLVPLVASCGVPVAKLSGRGLGFTGGTVDKLESIEGFRSHLTRDEFVRQVQTIGCAISGHSEDLAPAERRFYELRDVTGTVPSIPLIASSILSKKIAGGSRSFVFDVKTGSGAFMRTLEDSRALARQLVDLSSALGYRSLALISGMDQPLGRWVGNAAEVREAIDILKNAGPSDTRDLCIRLGGAMLFLAGKTKNLPEGEDRCRKALTGGYALERFRMLLEAQKGQTLCIDDPERALPLAPIKTLVRSGRGGVIASFETERIGTALRHLGGGRRRKEDSIDPRVAIEVLLKIGEEVSPGEPVFAVYRSNGPEDPVALSLLEEAYAVSESASVQPIVREVLDPLGKESGKL
jgi:pyrimidine-nucleoside phosphorylase